MEWWSSLNEISKPVDEPFAQRSVLKWAEAEHVCNAEVQLDLGEAVKKVKLFLHVMSPCFGAFVCAWTCSHGYQSIDYVEWMEHNDKYKIS